MRNIFIILISVILLFYSAKIVRAQDSIVELLNQNVLPIKTVSPNENYEDLMPLKSVLKDKRIIAMGEATHGTSEIFEMKHRMFKFLVNELGFRILGIEADFSACNYANNYVMYNKGDAQTALSIIGFWTWNTIEVKKLLEWMRLYNSTKPDSEKVKFYGFDFLYEGGVKRSILRYVKAFDSLSLNRVKVDLDRIDILKQWKKNASKTKLDSILQRISKIENYSNARKEYLIKESTESEYKLFIHYINSMRRYFEKYIWYYSHPTASQRDSIMAQNVKWILDLEGADSKIMLWSHNNHINKQYMKDSSIPMGYYLSKIYRNYYYTIAFDFDHGGFQAKNKDLKLSEFVVGASKMSSSTHTYSQVNHPVFFLDYSKIYSYKIGKGFYANGSIIRDIGATFNPETENFYYDNFKINAYDALIFIRDTHSASPNPSVSRINSDTIPLHHKHNIDLVKYNFNLRSYECKKMKLSMELKTRENAKNTSGSIRIEIDNKSGKTFQLKYSRKLNIDSNWKRFEVISKIPKDGGYMRLLITLKNGDNLEIKNLEVSVLDRKTNWVLLKD